MSPEFQRPHLDRYQARSTQTVGRGYTLFVRVSKIVLALLAIVIIGVTVARLNMAPPQALKADVAAEEKSKTTPGQIELTSPKYEGVDDQRRPYTITADKAVRDNASPDVVTLLKPMGDLFLEGDAWLALSAHKGQFDQTAGVFQLSDGVQIYHDAGHEMTLQDVTLNIKTREASSMKAVRLQSPLGMLEAQNMRVSNDGNLIVFGGPVAMTLTLQRPDKKS
jgi:lipopolysaccharide export system protein LptC